MATLNHREHRRHPIKEVEDVGALRRAVATLAATGCELRSGEVELVATELGTNLLKHAEPGGYVLYRQTEDSIELTAVDTGPGMGVRRSSASDARVSRFADIGLSAGLAGIARMATEYDVYSGPAGTVMLARVGGRRADGPCRWRYGVVNVPLGGTGPSGDLWAVEAADETLAVLVVDGLGHGDEAAIAARAAVQSFSDRAAGSPEQCLLRAHDAMRGTRGGVAAVAVIDPDAGQLTFAGIGNIAGQVVYRDRRKEHLLSHPGTLGTQLSAPKVRVRQHPWAPGATLLLASDGIRSGWDLSAYPGLLEHCPQIIAAVLHRDYARPNDDATVLVVQETS